MASGSAGRGGNAGSKGFSFATDDILCSFEDYGNQDGSNGTTHSDPAIGATSAKEFHKNRMARSSVFPAASYSPPEESSFNQDVIVTVERTMKKYADNLMRFLEGISSRLSQLELYCYNLDKTIGEMRSELVADHTEAETKLKSLEKHLQEVHRSVQILRDKQELADAQKELAKLQLAQKESSSASNLPQKEERVSSPASDAKKSENPSDSHGQQLALALPHQVPQPQQQQLQPPLAPQPPMPSQSMPQAQAYYVPPPQMPNVPAPAPAPQPSQGQYLPPDSQYRAPQLQDVSRVAPQPAQSQVNQTPQVQPIPSYQSQWPQQLPQQVQPMPQQSVQPQIRPSSPPVYSSYLPNQPNPPPPEALPNSMPMQVQFSGISQPGPLRAETVPYGYGGAARPVQPQPQPQHLKATYTSPADGYAASGPHPTLPPGNTYVMYDEAGRPHHPAQQPHFPQSPYPSATMPPQSLQPNTGSNLVVRPPQFVRNHPYGELIDKLVSMGYRGDHVLSVIQRLEESGQPVDFNTVLDRLNGHSTGGPQRGWSG